MFGTIQDFLKRRFQEAQPLKGSVGSDGKLRFWGKMPHDLDMEHDIRGSEEGGWDDQEENMENESAPDKRKAASLTCEEDVAGKRARAGDGGGDDASGDLGTSSRQLMTGQGLGGSSASVVRSAAAAGSGAAKVPGNASAPAATEQLQDVSVLVAKQKSE